MKLDTNYLHLLIIIVVVGAIYFNNCIKTKEFRQAHINTNKNNYNNAHIYEGFALNSRLNIKPPSESLYKKGVTRYNQIHGNPLIIKDEKHIKLVNQTPNTKERNLSKLYLDSNLKGAKLKRNGYIMINLKKNQEIKHLVITGLRKFRVDYKTMEMEMTKGGNVNKPILHGSIVESDLEIPNLFTLMNNNNKPFVAKVIKITNLSTNEEISAPVKVELYSNSNNNTTPLKKICPNNIYNNKPTISVHDIDNNNYYLAAQSNQNLNVVGISLKTNIPKFKLSTSVPGRDREMTFIPKENNNYFAGGVDGNVDINMFFNSPQQIKYVKIIPFLNPNSNNSSYFIKDINFVVKDSLSISSNNNNSNNRNNNNKRNNSNNRNNKIAKTNNNIIYEPFQGAPDSFDTTLLDDLQKSVEISKACEALEHQEDINESKKILEENQLQQMKLNNQINQIQKLEKEIHKITQDREKQMDKFDKFNVARFHKNKGHVTKLKEVMEASKKRQTNMQFNLHLLDGSESIPGNRLADTDGLLNQLVGQDAPTPTPTQ